MDKWFVTAKKADFNKIADEFGISPVIARIIRNRDVEGSDAIRKFLYGNVNDLLACIFAFLEPPAVLLRVGGCGRTFAFLR